MKVCKICKVEKSLDEYSTCKKSRDGKEYRCNKCRNEWQKKYRQENNEHVLKVKNDYFSSRPKQMWCERVLNRHKNDGYDVIITKQELHDMVVDVEECPHCDIKLDWNPNKGVLQMNSPSLDRLNNENQVRSDNIGVCCYKCNKMKGNRTMREWVEYCTYIANKYESEMACGNVNTRSASSNL